LTDSARTQPTSLETALAEQDVELLQEEEPLEIEVVLEDEPPAETSTHQARRVARELEQGARRLV